jgi:hypothetical protein
MTDEDQRDSRRQRIYKEGHIITLDNKSVVNCAVRDLTSTGARLKAGDQASVPPQFRLRIGQEATMRAARVVWRRGNEAGILFTGEPEPAPRAKPKA